MPNEGTTARPKRRWLSNRRAVMAGISAAVVGTFHQSRTEIAHAAALFGTTNYPAEAGVSGVNDSEFEGATGVSGSAGVIGGGGATYGVRGDSFSTSTGAAGVWGQAGKLTGATRGVQGTSTSGSGIQGSSTTGDGILGFSSGNLKYSLAGSGSGQTHGLIGHSQNQFGVSGINQNGNNWAGAFFNAQANAPGANKQGLFVQGDFVVVNGTKNAAVKTQKHGYRKMYAVEATENVFEDFGTASLKGGKARVELDEIFAETVNTGQKYQVYLTPKSLDSKGLAVVSQDAKGFSVGKLHGGTGGYEFDYRVVAKVRGQEAKRMEQFEPPAMPTPPIPSATAPNTNRGKP